MEKASARDSAVPATLKTAENDDEDEDEKDSEMELNTYPAIREV
jgi:hypothetical protein